MIAWVLLVISRRFSSQHNPIITLFHNYTFP
uniref:Uncharacterized protein n=1 Tax=Siphoviridae sp. ctbvd11 TaxID=2825567 RepID=A0A8S5QDJ2_9CAUD|nr:MAG TPA: hypothetical protein [Siphoviridae sp. ctbvd11]